jgi:UDP-glucuronate 4-epimerase
LGKKAIMQLVDMQPGDVAATYADVDDLIRDVAFKPSTTIEKGVSLFVKWYLEFYSSDSGRDRPLAHSN